MSLNYVKFCAASLTSSLTSSITSSLTSSLTSCSYVFHTTGRIVVIDYRDGRIDCDHPESTDNDILLPHGRITNTSKFLCEIFPTMTTRESVALMGKSIVFLLHISITRSVLTMNATKPQDTDHRHSLWYRQWTLCSDLLG